MQVVELDPFNSGERLVGWAVLAVIALGAAVFATYVGITSASAMATALGLGALIAVGAFVGAALLPRMPRRRGLLRIDSSAEGIMVPAEARLRPLWIGVVIAWLVGLPAVLGLWLVATGGLDAQPRAMLIPFALMPVIAVWGVRDLRKWTEPPGIQLRQNEVHVVPMVFEPYTLDWKDVGELTGARIPLRTMLGNGVRAYPANELLSDPDLVAELVDYYRSHPKARNELRDGSAVNRIATGRFLARARPGADGSRG